jgi:HK97 gp10 family phage protein
LGKVVVVFDRYDKSQREAKDEFKDGLIDMATNFQGAAQSLAPVETGHLRANIKTYPQTYPEVEVVSEAPYSGYLEFGTRDIQPPIPFMRPAYEHTRQPGIAYLGQRIKRRVN